MMKLPALTLMLLAIPAMAQDAPTPAVPLGIARVATSPSEPGCTGASIKPDTGVEIDWGCVEKAAAQYDQRNPSELASIAYILKALRDGKAIAK